VSESSTDVIREAVAAEVRRAELRRRRDELRAHVAQVLEEREAERRERERIPPCAGCGLRHGGRYTSVIGPLCIDCSDDAGRGGATRHRDELRDVLAWRVTSGDHRRSHVSYVPGLAVRLGFRFFAEADVAAARAETTRPRPSSTRFGHLDVAFLRARNAAASLPPERTAAVTVTDLADWHALRRRERPQEGSPLHVKPWPSGVVVTTHDESGALASTFDEDANLRWGRKRARGIFDRALRRGSRR
jgi:hypothetical protein